LKIRFKADEVFANPRYRRLSSDAKLTYGFDLLPSPSNAKVLMQKKLITIMVETNTFLIQQVPSKTFF